MSPTIPTIQSAESSLPNSPRGVRKRVCKACDRCRLKKGKCDGANQCSRCKTDNAICVFGERKRSQEGNYPKGYAEMLEQQQAQLVSALTEMYYQLRRASAWEGPSLDESDGRPAIHDILSTLDLLEMDSKSNEVHGFEEECDKRQFKMTMDHASLITRRRHVHTNSKVAESHQGQPGTTMSGNPESVQPMLSSPTENFDRSDVTSTLVTQSTISSWEAPQQQPNVQAPVAQHMTFEGCMAFTNDERTSVSEWEHALAKLNETYQAYCGESKAFGVSSCSWESAPIFLDSYQDLLPRENFPSMSDTNNLFNLSWIGRGSSDFIWQPEMTTWTT